MNAKHLLLPILVILVAGCLSDGESIVQKATGLDVISFQPSMQQITEKDRVDLALIVQNNGAFKAENTNANLYLHGSFTPYADSSDTTHFFQSHGTIRPPNVELKSQGETHEFRWKLRAPVIGEGEKTYPFTFSADIQYDYKSSVWKEFPILTPQRVQELRVSEQPLPVSKTGFQPSPLMMKILVYEPVVYSPETENITITVDISKVSEGHVKTESLSDLGECNSKTHCIDLVVLSIPSNYLNFTGVTGDCDFTDTYAGTAETGYLKRQVEYVNLIDGNYAQLKCTLKMNNTLEEAEVFPLVRANAEYTYHTRASTGVTVVTR